jgi:hypothetical protein
MSFEGPAQISGEMQEHDNNTRHYHKQKALALNLGTDTSETRPCLVPKVHLVTGY